MVWNTAGDLGELRVCLRLRREVSGLGAGRAGLPSLRASHGPDGGQPVNVGSGLGFLGGQSPQMTDYVCPACGHTESDELPPECPADGTAMEPAGDEK
jgi:hypothetical protein